MKRIIASLAVAFSFVAVAANAADSTTINGYISDAMCGAKHAGTGTACAKKCIGGGSAHQIVIQLAALLHVSREDGIAGRGAGRLDDRTAAVAAGGQVGALPSHDPGVERRAAPARTTSY